MKIYLVRHEQCESNVIGRYNFVDEDINETEKKTLILEQKTINQKSFLVRTRLKIFPLH